MSLYKKNIRVLLIEPAVQRPTFDRAKPNGNLGPAYIIGALRKHGVEVDYIDATVGPSGSDLNTTYFLRSSHQGIFGKLIKSNISPIIGVAILTFLFSASWVTRIIGSSQG